jgi:hypothetical protein
MDKTGLSENQVRGKIIPLHRYDDTKLNRSLIVDFMLKFDDVLDVEMLINALERLFTIGNWKKLGARLRLNVS